MSQSPIAHADSLRIGTVDFVSPDEVKVLLDIEAPESVALNAGGARAFPRVNGYLLIPVDDGYLVGQIEWLTVERADFPKRRGVRDFGLVDLPYPLRKMRLNPLGTLRQRSGRKQPYTFRRGADALPPVGAPVLLPTSAQLKSIVESGERRRVRIGTSPLAENAEVSIDPDRLFGRHLAVLGNTGSGKSCSVAGLIRWSLKAAQFQRADGRPNARFIVLDPNGEYSRAFAGDDELLKARIFRMVPEQGQEHLRVPLWFWNSAEWIAFSRASTQTQRPALVQALRTVRDQGAVPAESINHELRRFLRTIVTTIRFEKHTGSPWASFPKPKAFFEKIEKWKAGLEPELNALTGDEEAALKAVTDCIEGLCVPRRQQYANHDFTRQEIDNLLQVTSQAHSTFGGSDVDLEPVDADVPRPFTGDALLRSVEATAEMMGVSAHTETLLIRLRTLLADAQMKAVIGASGDLSLEKWLEDYIGANDARNGCVAVIDLSLVPSEIVHVVIAVTARMVFEALQRHRKLTKETIPTVLVMEEAHTFIKRYKDEVDSHDAAQVCCQVFERIAREGRKFGLGLVLSSQRPSELSPTVLSQCNTFLLHRISNDRDQDLVHRFVPDNLRGLLRELPSLPSQHAILLGWASELPILVRMDDLPKEQQPQSDDPDFWNVWLGETGDGTAVARRTEWPRIAMDWQGAASGPPDDSADGEHQDEEQ
jgi:hypothetical protein